MATTDETRAHYAKRLGSVAREFHIDDGPIQFDILTVPGAPYGKGTTVATVGLSKYIEQEFLLACHSDQFQRELITLLAVVAKEQAVSRKGLRRGQVLGPAGPLVSWGTTEALYVSPPAYFGPDFEPLTLADHRHVHFFWLVPIHVGEARWAKATEHDPDTFRFEELLVDQDPDLLDFNRPEIDLGDSNAGGG